MAAFHHFLAGISLGMGVECDNTTVTGQPRFILRKLWTKQNSARSSAGGSAVSRTSMPHLELYKEGQVEPKGGEY